MNPSHPLAATDFRTGTGRPLATGSHRANEMGLLKTNCPIIHHRNYRSTSENGNDSQPPPRITAHPARIQPKTRAVSLNRYP